LKINAQSAEVIIEVPGIGNRHGQQLHNYTGWGMLVYLIILKFSVLMNLISFYYIQRLPNVDDKVFVGLQEIELLIDNQ
jgi:hypothetical protein